jgi:hypothetical protein
MSSLSLVSEKDSPLSRITPGMLLFITTIELVVLMLLLLGRAMSWFGMDTLPNPIGGVVPLAVPWAGALGGVSLSLVGIAAHAQRWSTEPGQGARWNTWYLTRPLLGAVFGSFGALIVVLVVGAIGLDQNGQPDLSTFGSATLTVMAYVVGYRPQTFEKLLGRAVGHMVGAESRKANRSVSADSGSPNAERAPTHGMGGQGAAAGT